MKLYMVVTKDKYELPLIVTESIEEMARFLRRPLHSVKCAFTPSHIKSNSSFRIVEVDD